MERPRRRCGTRSRPRRHRATWSRPSRHRATRSHSRAERRRGADVLHAAQGALGSAFAGHYARPLLHLALTELQLVYYALFGWLGRPTTRAHAFTYHRGYDASLMVVLAIATLVEIVPIHVLAHSWSPLAAWVLTGVSAYGLLWLVGSLVALRRRPILIAGGALHLRVGLWRSALVPLSEIVAVERLEAAGGADASGASTGSASGDRTSAPRRAGGPPPGRPAAAAGCPAALTDLDLALGEAQFVLRLARPVTAYGPLWLSRQGTSVGLRVDEPDRFFETIARFVPGSTETPAESGATLE